MVLGILAAVALAANPAPLALVKSADAEVNAVLKAPEPTVEKLAAKAESFVDFAELAKRAMGKNWEPLSPKQRQDFSDTMKALLRANYAQKAIKEGRGEAKIEYGEEKVTGDEATVATTLVVKEDRFTVLYKLFRPTAKAAWRVYDVVTDDVSLVSTYADQFRTQMAKKGFDGLLASLKAKKDQLEKAPVANGG